MSDTKVERRLLQALATPGAVLAPFAAGYGVYSGGDRRRRPRFKAARALVNALAEEGALEHDAGGSPDAWCLSPAGAARARRALAPEALEFTGQHAHLTKTGTLEEVDCAAMLAVSPQLARLAALQDANARPWFSLQELSAARRLLADVEAGARGASGCMDWSRLGAAPRSSAAGSGGAESAVVIGARARDRVAAALAALAPPLRAVVMDICIQGQGLEAVERVSGWPPRSAKLALRLALAQLAETYRGGVAQS